jgi:hypothetical protein
MTDTREDLITQIAAAMTACRGEPPRARAKAALEAIEKADAVIVPLNPAMKMYWDGCEHHFNSHGDKLIPLTKETMDFWRAMLSASPFHLSDGGDSREHNEIPERDNG